MGQIIDLSEKRVLMSGPEDWLAPPFEILECRVYKGPHLYSHTPMIRIQADLGLLEEWPTNRLPGFAERLVELLPGLAQHGCSSGHAGGLIARMKEGTWMGHVIEHVALELQSQAGLSVARGKTRSVKDKPGCYNIMYEYKDEEAGRCAGRMALDLVASVLEPPFHRLNGRDKVYRSAPEPFNLAARLAELRKLVKYNKLGPTTQAIVSEAERRNIPWMKMGDGSLIQLGTGRFQKRIRASVTDNTSNIAVETASDKGLTKKLLAEAGVPVPAGEVVRTKEGAVEVARELGFPVVLKPLDGNHGRGVSTNLNSEEAVAEAFVRASEHSKRVIVEQFYAGRDYRILVVKGEVVAVSERVPAHIFGNGTDTIAKLIEEVNADPRRGDGHEEVMTRIKIDNALIATLARSGLTLETVPAKKQRIVLSATANLSTGGTAVDRTDSIHPDNALIARRAALAVGLDVAGIDMMLPDITQSWREHGGGIVEVNASPGFRMHICPTEGRAHDVARPVLSSLFPHGAKTQVPVVMVTGTNGKSTTVRMVAHILKNTGLAVGFTSTSGIYVNDECIWKGDASGPKSARLLLRDPTIDVAILETARGGILREGLGVSDCDVGAVLNITPDHLGISGIDTLDDLAAVKSVVTESVRRHGVSVLNADDPRTFDMARHAGGSVCYFSSKSSDTSTMREHIEKGGQCVTREMIGGTAQIVLHKEGERIPVVGINEIPATFSGHATFNIENALAATAIATGLGIDSHAIKTALSSFGSSFEQNPGRFNINDDHGFRVIMDYAHNPAALNAFFDMIRSMRTNYIRVIGHVSTPGDRREEDIREVGRIAGRELDICVFRELPDNRGRPVGEVVRLLAEGARSVGCSEDKIICVHPEEEATDICLKTAQPGDLVILFPTRIEKTWQQVKDFRTFVTEIRQPKSTEEQRKYVWQ